MNQATRYSLKDLKEILGRKSIQTSRFRHPGKVLQAFLEVANNQTARVVYIAEFPIGDGNETVVEEVFSVL